MRVRPLYDKFRKPFSLPKEVGQGIYPYLPTADGISTGILIPRAANLQKVWPEGFPDQG